MRLLCLSVVSLLVFSCGSSQNTSVDAGVEPLATSCSGSVFGYYRRKTNVQCPDGYTSDYRRILEESDVLFQPSLDGGLPKAIVGVIGREEYSVIPKECSLLLIDKDSYAWFEFEFRKDGTLEEVGRFCDRFVSCPRQLPDGGFGDSQKPLSCKIWLEKY